MGRPPHPEDVKLLRRRLRRLRYGDVTRLATAAGMTRSTVHALRFDTTRVPRPKTIEALTTALDALHPLRRPAVTKLPEVESPMTKPMLISVEMVETYAAPAFAECDMASFLYSPDYLVDLDKYVYDAVDALSQGKTLEAALACIKDENVRGEYEKHPAADKVRAAFAALPPYGEFMSRAERYEPIFDYWRILSARRPHDLELPPVAAAVHALVQDPDATPWFPKSEADWRDLWGELQRLHAQVRGDTGAALSA